MSLNQKATTSKRKREKVVKTDDVVAEFVALAEHCLEEEKKERNTAKKATAPSSKTTQRKEEQMLAALTAASREKAQKRKDQREKKRQEKKEELTFPADILDSCSKETFPKKQKVSCEAVCEDNFDIDEDDLQRWTTTRKPWETMRKKTMEEWEESRPNILSAYLRSQLFDETCQSCEQHASVWCTDGCGAFCHECDYTVHSMQPLHHRNTRVEYHCFTCLGKADIRCRECEHEYCNECHSSIVGHENHTVQPCVGLSVTLSGCWFKLSQFSVGKRDTYLRTFNTKCCNEEMRLETRATITIVNFKGKFECIRIPSGYCQSCDTIRETKLKDLLALNLFPGSPSQVLSNGMSFYDMSMLRMIEILKREDPSLALRAIIHSIQAASMSRDGAIAAQNFYDVYREHSFMSYSIEELSGEVYTECPACKDGMLACHYDGNHKLFRYNNSSKEKRDCYMGDKFFVSNSDVDKCEKKFSTSKSSTNPGTCGGSTLQSAKSSSKKYKHLDETGTVMACCRHNILLKGLNMKRGEVYSYPLCLQLQLPNHTFMAQDVVCQYRPWLEGVAGRNPQDEEVTKLLQQKPFLSVLHAYAHSWHCQVLVGGRYQVGAGMTTGEELEQCHAKLSRAAATTRVMSKARREEELTLLALSMNKKRVHSMPQTLKNKEKKNEKQLTLQQQQLSDLLQAEDVSENQVYEWKTELQSVAKDLKGKRNLDVDELEKQIEILGMSVKRAHGSILAAGSSKAVTRLVSSSSNSNTKLSKLIDQYNDNSNVKITESHRKSGVWPWQDGLLQDLTTKRKCVDTLMKRDRMLEERAILSSEIASLHNSLGNEISNLLFKEVTPEAFPYKERKYSCMVDGETVRAIIALRNVVAYEKSVALEQVPGKDDSRQDIDVPDVTEDGFINAEDNTNEHKIIEQFDTAESESD